jgi:tRNA dimethylallyltransferase
MGTHSELAPLVVIVGETASGKSALALELAEMFNGEIVCADSWTVRRRFDIGTAKPSETEQARIPHHLIDVVEPCADFTAAVFQQMAKKSINEITKRDKLPIMVGGTGLYIDSVLFDFSFLPEPSKEMRHTLNALDREELLSKIEEKGLDIANIDTRNKRRLMRLLEAEGALPTKKALRPHTVILGIQLSRETLKTQIARRIEQQLANGLEDEVRQLAEEFGWECEGLKGISYREWQGYFAGTQSLEQTKEKIIKSTLDLAKRQRTWFKRNKSIHWVQGRDDAVEIITTFLNK